MSELLHLNDRDGEHAPSWYAAGVEAPEHPALLGGHQAEIVIIGAGLTGLSAARRLARAGREVIVLDAQRVGWGASGRNGGQLGSGFNRQYRLEKQLGRETDLALWRLAEKAKRRVHELCREHAIDVDWRPGILQAEHRQRHLADAERWLERLQTHYDYDQVEWISREALTEHVKTDDYHGGILDRGAGHLDPLKLTLGLAAAAREAGAHIHERSEVVRVDDSDALGTSRFRVVCAQGHVNCHEVLFCGNGYLRALAPEAEKRMLPLNNFIIATEPLGQRADELMPSRVAVADSRFVVFYFRMSPDGRLLFGGGESMHYRFPARLESLVRNNLLKVFPSLADVRIDHAWGGTLAITMNRLPLVRECARGELVSCGYSGHGVALAVLCGEALAGHLLDDDADFQLLSRLPSPIFPGGTHLRPALLWAGMSWFSALDRLP